MKGLFVKDLRLMMVMRSTIAFVLVWMAVWLIGEIGQSVFIVSLFILIFSLLASSTISYDDYDDGFGFIFTLPILKKHYVIEKYLFSFIMTIIGSVVSFAIMALISKNVYESLITVVVICVVSFIMNIINIPMLLKFGSEKAKIYRIILMAIFMVIATSLLDNGLQGLLDKRIAIKLLELSELQIGLIVGIIVGLLVIVSMKISIKIIEKKEF